MFAFFIACVFVGGFFAGEILGAPGHPKCRPPRGLNCVEIRKCPYFAKLLDTAPKPRPPRLIQIIRMNQCGFVGFSPLVCCHMNPDAPAEADSRELPDVSRHLNLGMLRENCGGSPGNDARITRGSATRLMEFPWMALILYHTDKGIDFKCGGTLINERYILTAAHCVVNLNVAGVRLGEHNVNTEKDCDPLTRICAPPVLDFYIEDIIVHQQYDPKKLSNDIALLRLATTVNTSFDNIKPICLPIGANAKKILDGTNVIVTGWGVTENDYKSAELRKVSIPVISTSDCKRIVSPPSQVTARQICAGGYLGGDSCGGDSGGPLQMATTVEFSVRYVQFGIVSYGPRICGAPGRPGVYTRVAYYMDWILDSMRPWMD